MLAPFYVPVARPSPRATTSRPPMFVSPEPRPVSGCREAPHEAPVAGALLAVCVLASPAATQQKKALFDNAHAGPPAMPTGSSTTRSPSVARAGTSINAGTAFTYWNSAISSWGVSLVKRGYRAHERRRSPTGTPRTLRPVGLRRADHSEPNTVFTAAERRRSSPSCEERRRCGHRVPIIGAPIATTTAGTRRDLQRPRPTHLLGVSMAVSGNANNNVVQTSTNVNALATDMVTRGPVGNVTGLAFPGNGTTLTLYPAVNSTVRGEVWMNGLAQTSDRRHVRIVAVRQRPRRVHRRLARRSTTAQRRRATPASSTAGAEAGATGLHARHERDAVGDAQAADVTRRPWRSARPRAT